MSNRQFLSPPNTSRSHQTIDRYIVCETELKHYIDDLHKRKVHTVALDLEGDQGTIRYNYSVSIFQCFDGVEVVIIDVITMGNSDVLKNFLTDPAITKVMFSCANDIFITQNVLQCTISPVRDIAVAQKLLNEPVSLTKYLKIDPKRKDSFQRANWLRRPIAQDLLDYAVNDVTKLFIIEDALITQLGEAHLVDTYCKESIKLVEKDYRINQMHHYKVKFPGYPRLSSARRRAAATVWIFRELIGKHFNCPVGYVLSKKAMTTIISDPKRMVQSIEQELNRHRSVHKKIKIELIENLFQKAVQIVGEDG